MKTFIAALVAVSALGAVSTASAAQDFPGYIVTFADKNNDGVLTGTEVNRAERRLRSFESD